VAKQFNVGDHIQHRKTGTRAVVLDTYKDIGYWIQQDDGSCWCLQTNWTSDWRVM
jgi:hypothetical protein